MIKIKYWNFIKDPHRSRRRIATIVWGEGQRLLAGSKLYYGKKITLAFNWNKWFGYMRRSDEFRFWFFGFEIHFRKG